MHKVSVAAKGVSTGFRVDSARQSGFRVYLARQSSDNGGMQPSAPDLAISHETPMMQRAIKSADLAGPKEDLKIQSINEQMIHR